MVHLSVNRQEVPMETLLILLVGSFSEWVLIPWLIRSILRYDQLKIPIMQPRIP